MPDLESKSEKLDLASTGTIVVTAILFVVAIFEKGFTHDLLLEAGVFLVSAKLVIASYQAKVSALRLERKMDELAYRISPP